MSYDDELRELIGAAMHERWKDWTRYLLGTGYENHDGSIVVPPTLVRECRKGLARDWAALTDEERATERAAADRLINTLRCKGYTP